MSYSGGGGGGTNSNSSSGNNANLKVNNITSRDGKRGAEVTGIVEAKGTHFVPPSGVTGQRYADNGENIVRDGLVLYLDAKYSYNGFWYDMSGNGKDGESINGPSYSPTDGGSVVLDGSNDYIRGPAVLTKYSAGTIEAWIKTSNSGSPGGHIYGESTPGDATYWGHLRLHGGKLHFAIDDNSVVPEIRSTNTVNDNAWHQVVVTGSGNKSSDWLFYIDGQPESRSVEGGTESNLNDFWFNTNTLNAYTIGALERTSVGNVLGGNIAIVRTYNRALTAAEVLQNYDALKSRFGH
jgi:hypothetical protein